MDSPDLPPHVCHVTTSFPLRPGHFSGYFVWQQVRALADRGWEVSVLAPHAEEAARRETVEGVDIRRFRYLPDSMETVAYGGGIPANLKADRKRWLYLPPFFLAGVNSCYKQAGSTGLLHAHWSLAGLMVSTAAALRSVPYIQSFHGSDLMGASGPLRRAARHTARRADRVMVHSRIMAEEARALCSPEKIVCIPHGIEPDVFKRARPDEQDPVRLIAVGRLSREKGFDVLVEALARLHSRADWSCVVYGDGPEAEGLSSQAEKAGIANRIRFPGPVSHEDLLQELGRSSISVVPSRREGFGVACLEASASALPVVATRSGGPEDIVVDGETGLLVPSQDAAALSRAIERLLDEPALRVSLGEAGRKRAGEVFSMDRVTGQLLDMYREIMS